MTEQNNSSRGMRILVGVSALVVIIAGISLAQSVVVLLLFSFNHRSGGVPSSARKRETKIKTTIDCAKLTPAIIITSAATLTRIRIPRDELICSVINLSDYSFSLK